MTGDGGAQLLQKERQAESCLQQLQQEKMAEDAVVVQQQTMSEAIEKQAVQQQGLGEQESTNRLVLQEQQRKQHHRASAAAGQLALLAKTIEGERSVGLQHPGVNVVSRASAASSRCVDAAVRRASGLAATQSSPSLCSLEAALLSAGAERGISAADMSSSSMLVDPFHSHSSVHSQQRWQQQQQQPRLLLYVHGNGAAAAAHPHAWRCRRSVSSGNLRRASAVAAAADFGAVLTSCSSTSEQQQQQQDEAWGRDLLLPRVETTSATGTAAGGGAKSMRDAGGSLSGVAAAAAEATIGSVRAAALLCQTRLRLLQGKQQQQNATANLEAHQQDRPTRGVCCIAPHISSCVAKGPPSQRPRAFAADQTGDEATAQVQAAAAAAEEQAAAGDKTTEREAIVICRLAAADRDAQDAPRSYRRDMLQQKQVLTAPYDTQKLPTTSCLAAPPDHIVQDCVDAGGAAADDSAADLRCPEGDEGATTIAAEDRKETWMHGRGNLLLSAERSEDEDPSISTATPLSGMLSLSAATCSSSGTASVTSLDAVSLCTPPGVERSAAAALAAPACVSPETVDSGAIEALERAAKTRATAAAFAAEKAVSRAASSTVEAAAAAVIAADHLDAVDIPSPEAAALLKPCVLIIITGGTICMDYGGSRSSMRPQRLAERLQQITELRDPSLPTFDVLEWETLVDSSDVRLPHWERLALQIQQFYDAYDGFVVLHGTDTMAYTASALSFMLENLAKPVILTGSMLPMLHISTDAKRNLVASMLVAGCSELREVAVVFGSHVLRGCRVTKQDCSGFDAFASPNFPPLGVVGIDVIMNEEVLIRQSSCFAAAAAVLSPAAVVLPPAAAALAAAAATGSRSLQGASAAAVHQCPHASVSSSAIPEEDETIASSQEAAAVSTQTMPAAAAVDTPIEREEVEEGAAIAASTEGGLSVFCRMTQNIVALPLTPYLPLEVLQQLFAERPQEKAKEEEAAAEGTAVQQQENTATDNKDSTLKAREFSPEIDEKRGEKQSKSDVRSPFTLILLLYGSGTAPGSPELLETLRRGIERGVNVVILTQCRRGCANLLAYENGVQLYNLGVINGKDLTLEACVAKLSYLTGKGYTGKRLKDLMETDLRGEITENLNKVEVSNSRAAAAVSEGCCSSSVNEQTKASSPSRESCMSNNADNGSIRCHSCSLPVNTCSAVPTSSVASGSRQAHSRNNVVKGSLPANRQLYRTLSSTPQAGSNK